MLRMLRRLSGRTAFRTLAAGAALLALPLAVAPDTAAAQDRVTWKLHSMFPSRLPILGTRAADLVDIVDDLSQGSLRLQLFEPGALLPSTGYIEALSEGSLNAAWSAGGAGVARIPALTFFVSVPFGPAAGEFLAWLNYGGGNELRDELYGRLNIHPVLCGILPPEASGWFREEVTSLDDLNGMKIRFFGLGGRVLETFGVSTQFLAGGDIYPALERGVIDATEFSMPSVDEGFGFYQIAQHYYFPGWHQQATLLHLEVNADAWDTLSDWHKVVIESACARNIEESLAEGEGTQFDALERMQAEGVQLHEWSQESLDRLEAAWNDVIAQLAAEDEDMARVWQSYEEFRSRYAVWRDLGYLN